MTNTMRTFCGTLAMIVLPVLAGAQAKPAAPNTAPTVKRGDTAVVKHDMGALMQGMAQGEGTGWTELDAFQKLMMDTWHPASAGDLKLARANAPAVLAAALAWRKSRGPAKCDNAALRDGMANFMLDVRSYADAAKRESSDDAITVTLKRTHGDFEAMAMPCMTGAMKDMKMPDAPKKP